MNQKNKDLDAQIITTANKVLDHLSESKRHAGLKNLDRQKLLDDCLEYTKEWIQKKSAKYGDIVFEDKVLFYPIDSYFRQSRSK